MTDETPSDPRADWLPAEPDPDAEHFKWGWNETDGEAVWPVGGPGDGWPGHAEQLEAAWGRKLRAAGDALGAAEHVPARGTEAAVVAISVYYGEQVPSAVMSWFKTAFPDAQIRLAGLE